MQVIKNTNKIRVFSMLLCYFLCFKVFKQVWSCKVHVEHGFTRAMHNTKQAIVRCESRGLLNRFFFLCTNSSFH